jgi:hypothetical protein
MSSLIIDIFDVNVLRLMALPPLKPVPPQGGREGSLSAPPELPSNLEAVELSAWLINSLVAAVLMELQEAEGLEVRKQADQEQISKMDSKYGR